MLYQLAALYSIIHWTSDNNNDSVAVMVAMVTTVVTTVVRGAATKVPAAEMTLGCLA
jgi:hypothetical protein